MDETDVVILAGPMSNHVADVLECLQSEGIRARLVSIQDVAPAQRPDWACTPGNEVYIVAPKEQQLAAHEVQRWMSRVCLQCGTTLPPKALTCPKCQTRHAQE